MSRIRPHPRFFVILTLMVVLLAGAALAQTTTATLKGRVVDPEGDPVGGVEITAVNTVTGNNYSVLTGNDGRYLLAGLRPGTYTLVVASPAFEPKTQTMTVLVGQSITADFNLSPAVVLSESITVVGEQVVEMETSTIATSVTTQQIETLPQNSRNFMNFAALAPGIIMSDPDYRKEFRSGAQDSRAVNVFIDGISYKNDILTGGIVGQDASPGNPFPQAAVQEFRVLTQNYSAEFQKSSSAVITAVTKSGTNTVAGEVFAYFQDEALVDDNPITDAAEETFERLQTGVAVGGPITRDSLHYFLSYEGNDQDQQRTVVMGPLGPAALRQEFSQFEGTFPTNFDARLFFAKATWQPSGSQILDLSAFLRDEDRIADVGGRNTWDNRENVMNEVQNYGLRHQFTTTSWFNEASVNFQEYDWNPTPQRLDLPGRHYFDILNLGGRCCEQDKSQSRLSLRDDLTFSPLSWAGTHTIKVGANVDFTDYDLTQTNFGNQRYYYRSQDNWEFPFRVEYGYGDPQTGGDNTVYGLYVTDEWAPTDRLLLNVGVRYDYESDMFPTDWVTPESVRAVAPYVDTSRYFTDGNDRSAMDDMIAPRLGITYDLLGNDRTVVFGGWGRYYDRMIRGVTNAEKLRQSWIQGDLFFSREGGTIVDGNVSVAWKDEYLNKTNLFQLLEQGRLFRSQVFLIENDTKAPYADQWNIGVRQKFGDFVAAVSYANTESVNGFTWGWSETVWEMARNNQNGFSLNPLGRCCGSWAPLNALGFNEVLTSRDDKRTWYEAIYLTIDKPLTANSFWGGGLAYTGTITSEAQGGDDFSLDYQTIADFPIRPLNDAQDHYLVANAIFRLPANFTVGSVLTYGSGRRYNIFDQSLGTGPLQQNLWGKGEGSPYTTIDLRLQYDLELGPVALGLIGEAFNITNDEVENQWFDTIATLPNVNPRFGEARNIVDNSQRRFQYGVRLRF